MGPGLVSLLLTIAGSALGSGAPPGPAVAEPPALLVLALDVPGIPMDVALSAVQRGPLVFLPLGELSRAVEVAIDVDPGLGVAEGFFSSESRRFRLDAGAREIHCGGKSFPWDSTGIVVLADDIYVATELLATWFDLRFDLRRQASAITVHSDRPLPIEARAARARRIQQTLLRAGADRPDYPSFRDPYRLLSRPFVDQQLSSSIVRRDRQHASDWQYTSYLTGDLLYLAADLQLRGSRRDPLTDVNGGAGRRDPQPVLLGPLHAREFRAGEVGYPGLALIARAASGPGVLVSNFPAQRPSQYGEHSFFGPLRDGWDVELHRDDALIGYQGSVTEGAYRFDGVPLNYGINEFRLVFNGPHGERRESREVFNVGPSLTPPGELFYRAAANGLGEAHPRAQLETEFHVAGTVSGSVALASVDMRDRAHQYGAAGLRGFWNFLFAAADLAADGAGGGAMEVRVQARSRRLGVGVRHAELSNGFRSEVFDAARGAVERRTSGVFDGSLLPRRGVHLPLQLELKSEALSGGRRLNSLANRVGLGFGRVSLSHQMRRVVSRGPETPDDADAKNTMLASMRFRRWALRGTVDYAPGPDAAWQDVHLVAEGPVRRAVYGGLGVGHDPRSGLTRLSADLRAGQGALGWSARAEVGSRNHLSLSLGLSVGLNQEPRRGGWQTDARPVAGSGAASAQVFLDTNGNGSRDADEPGLTGVEFKVNGAHQPRRTDDDGVLFLTNLPGGQAVDLELSAGTLEDPLWVPQVPGLSLVPRPGRAALVDFPVVISGEVVGTVSVSRPNGTRAAGGVTLELVDVATGQVVRQIVTAYDGFFDLLAIPPGRFQLRIADSQWRRFGLESAPSRAIEIAPTGTVHEGVDFLLEPKPAAPDGK